MHFTSILVFVLASLTALRCSPARAPETSTQRPRPIQQFFKNILIALRRTTTPIPPTMRTTKRTTKPSPWHTSPDLQEIPNFVDFSTYLLGSFASNNSAIKFSYMQPNNESVAPGLRGNYSVVSFLIPHEKSEEDPASKGVFSFLGNLKLPWNRQPGQPPPSADTTVSKFPPLLEYFTQRIQAYYSVYKYEDDSRLNNTFVVLIPETPEVYGTASAQNDDEVTETTMTELPETTTYSPEPPSTDIGNEVEWQPNRTATAQSVFINHFVIIIKLINIRGVRVTHKGVRLPLISGKSSTWSRFKHILMLLLCENKKEEEKCDKNYA